MLDLPPVGEPLLAGVGDGPVVLLGHSMGAGPAMLAAVRAAQLGRPVRALVLVTPALPWRRRGGCGPFGDGLGPTAAAGLRGLRILSRVLPALVDSLARWPPLWGLLLAGLDGTTEPVEGAARARMHATAAIGGGYAAKLCAWASASPPPLAGPVLQRLAACGTRTVILLGGRDGIVVVPERHGAGWCIRVPEAGHLLHETHPEVVWTAVLRAADGG